MVPTFQYSRHRNQTPVLSANSLCCCYAAHCAEMSSYDRFIRGKKWKTQGAKSGRMMVGDQTTSHRKRFRSLFAAAAVCDWAIVMKKDNTWGQHSSSLVLKEKSNYSTHSTFGGRLYCFRRVYGFATRSGLSSAMCRDRRAYWRHCGSHLHKASSDLTVVLITRPTGLKKKKRKIACVLSQ